MNREEYIKIFSKYNPKTNNSVQGLLRNAASELILTMGKYDNYVYVDKIITAVLAAKVMQHWKESNLKISDLEETDLLLQAKIDEFIANKEFNNENFEELETEIIKEFSNPESLTFKAPDLKHEHRSVIANDFIKGELKISLLALKIFLVAVNEIDAGLGPEHDTEFYNYKIPLTELMPIFDIPATRKHSIYDSAKTAVKELLSTQIIVSSGKTYKGVNLVSMAQSKDGYIYIRLNQDMKPYFLQLERNFTQLQTDIILKMQSIHSVKIFTCICMELGLLQAREGKKPYADNKCSVSISVDDIRLMTNTQKKYPATKDFRKYVIEPAIEEINNCSDYHIEIGQVQTGKSISAYTFTIQSKASYLFGPKKKKIKKKEI